MSREYVDSMVRRRIGLDVLRRLQRLVDADLAQEADNARLAQRVALALAVLAGLTFIFFLFR